MINTIDQALDYIYSFINLENSSVQKYKSGEYSLDNIREILQYFPLEPHRQQIIHVAGTKGKGSTSLFITALLRTLDYTISTFMSPHLLKPNERFLYNLTPIGDHEIINLTRQIREILLNHQLIPTTFELFLILFLLFSQLKQADYQVVEVGLGGRLDCTNIVDPLISVITSISFDHTHILGKTIRQIASEKAGIIKPNKPVVLARQHFRCRYVFKNRAAALNAPFYETVKSCKLLNYKAVPGGLVFDFDFNHHRFTDFFLANYGLHQIENFFTALVSVYLINPEIVGKLQQLQTLQISLPGRIELIQQHPPIILDVAHNGDSALKLRETLSLHFPGVKWNILSGMAMDKDYRGFYTELQPIALRNIITSPSRFKKSNPLDVYQKARETINETLYIPNFIEACRYISALNEPILITGSFYIAGPFLEYWKTASQKK